MKLQRGKPAKIEVVAVLVASILTILFLAMKMSGVLDWPWLWVFAPVIALFLLVVGIVFVSFIFFLMGDPWG